MHKIHFRTGSVLDPAVGTHSAPSDLARLGGRYVAWKGRGKMRNGAW